VNGVARSLTYSRVRSTVEFTKAGAAPLPACESMKNAPAKYRTVEQLVISSTVSSDEIRMSQTVAALCAGTFA
jgi:hypothetical protein